MAKLTNGRFIQYKAYRSDNQDLPEITVAEWWVYELRNAAAASVYRKQTNDRKRRRETT